MNKYEICVSKSELYNYIKENGIQDKKLFRYDQNDFQFIVPKGGNKINFFDEDGDFINGWNKDSWLSYVCHYGKQVSPEEFLIAIGYLPKKPSVSPIKAEDIHYICEESRNYYPVTLSGELSPKENNLRLIFDSIGNINYISLSPEGLIELGSDLVRLGVALRDGTYQE